MPTHGSLTKAGKVRAQTPKVDTTSTKKSTGPIRKNKRNYHSRVLYQPDTRFGGRRRRRRR
ncbi:MAG: 30S ribosomal protein S30e [Candidatus Bathyarchaeota archaeon]|nr:30S ribosomal protein S30e [Candidatus Bathyarchaeota archaeon]